MRLFFIFFLHVINAYDGFVASVFENKQYLSSLLEQLGYSPVCVASSLNSCEEYLVKAGFNLQDLYLLPKLKSLLHGVKCDKSDILTEGDSANLTASMMKISDFLHYMSSIPFEAFMKNITNMYAELLQTKQLLSAVESRNSVFDRINRDELKLLYQQLKSATGNNFTKTEQEEINLFLEGLVSSEFEGTPKTNDNLKVTSVIDMTIKHKNCAEICGVRTVFPYDSLKEKPVMVSCDQTSDGGGWTVIQKRDSSVFRQDFERPWSDYVNGFGDINGEFWLGLENIYALANSTPMELRVDLEDYDGRKHFAKYRIFNIRDSTAKYTLTIGNYSGDAGDSLDYSNGMKFSTYDQDNDQWSGGNCSIDRRGGWWFKRCAKCNLNGYQHNGKYFTTKNEGIEWHHFRGDYYSLKKVSMKLRPIF